MHQFNKLTIREVILRFNSNYNFRPAVSLVNSEPITYGQLASEISRLQALLKRLGIQKGERVALLGSSSPNWVIAYLGITSMGAVAVPLMPEFTPTEIGRALNHSEASLLIATEKQLLRIEKEDLPFLRNKILLDTLSLAENYTMLDAPGPGPGEVPAMPEAEVEEDDLAAIIYTSGTTGNPKGVMLTHKNIVFDALQGFSVQDLNTGDVLLSILPLAHTYENTIGMMMPLIGGSCIYYLDKPPTASVLLPALT
ncbi:MAG: long-chain fatty acid--CoA ligase, partial [Bacteroidales bacterium]|nr:long-chain fatty acid--CoA ligase [Bacteroidales bacterium]